MYLSSVRAIHTRNVDQNVGQQYQGLDMEHSVYISPAWEDPKRGFT